MEKNKEHCINVLRYRVHQHVSSLQLSRKNGSLV